MARKSKTSAYAKYRNRIRSYIRRYEKQGLVLDIQTPATEKQIRKLGYTGQKLAKQTRELKKLLAQIQNVEGVNVYTGEVQTLKSYKKQKARRKMAKKQAEKERASLPVSGVTVFYNVLNDFIRKISEPLPEYTINAYGRKNPQYLREEAEENRQTLYNLTMRAVSQYGEEEIGNRLQNNPDLDFLVEAMLYGSSSTGIQTAYRRLAETITGKTLSLSELIDLGKEAENNESW